MAIAYVGLGSNIGNRTQNVRMALRGLTRMAHVHTVSSLYESEPEGGPPQPRFYNAVCRIETGLEPGPLLRFLKGLEHEIGRRPGGERNGPRPIDLDLLLYDEAVIEEDGLTIPHPRMLERAFVMTPMAEIAPELEVGGRAVISVAGTLGASGLTVVAEAGWDGVAAAEQDVRL
jgi:GTP cyclohydrolase-4